MPDAEPYGTPIGWEPGPPPPGQMCPCGHPKAEHELRLVSAWHLNQRKAWCRECPCVLSNSRGG